MAKPFIPRVTRILKDLGLIDLSGIPLEALESKRQLGISVHDICARLARGQEIDLEKLEGPIRQRAERFLWWLDFMNAKVISTEQRLTSEGSYPYTGRYDLVVEIDGLRWLIDIKPTFHTWNRLQLAAYDELLWRADQACVYRAVLPLDSSKHPGAILCELKEDIDAWKCCLESWWWRYRNGMIQGAKGER
jgi:hypothetical protein